MEVANIENRTGRGSLGHQQGAGRQPSVGAGTRNAHLAVFQWLPQRFDGGAPKLRQLVQEQHPVVRQADLAWAWHVSAADQACFADRVVRSPERPRIGPESHATKKRLPGAELC